jgi:hypothetical protein
MPILSQARRALAGGRVVVMAVVVGFLLVGGCSFESSGLAPPLTDGGPGFDMPSAPDTPAPDRTPSDASPMDRGNDAAPGPDRLADGSGTDAAADAINDIPIAMDAPADAPADVSTADATPDAALDGGPDAAADGSGSDASADVSADPATDCRDRYGRATKFILCETTDTSCSFSVTTTGTDCQSVCRAFGGTCLGAMGHPNGRGQECHVSGTDTCVTSNTSEICVCSR